MTIEQFKTDEVILSNINQDSIPRQVVMQGEKDGRSLTVQVTNGGVVETQAGLNLNLGWKHRTAKDKEGNLIQGLDAFTPIDRETGLFRIEYASSMAQPGTIDAEIQFVTSTSVTKSQPFIITVKPSTVDDSAVESESSFTVLQEALSHVSKYDEKIEGLEISKADRKKVEDLETSKADKDQVSKVEDMISKMPSATPKETFSNLAALQSKYPNGDTSAMVVLETDGKTGYVYLWDGSQWKKGALYQAQGIAERSVTSLQAEASVATTFVLYTNPVDPDYNTSTKILTIPKSSDGSSMVIFSGNELVVIPNEDIFVDATDFAGGSAKLIVDFDTKLFFWDVWSKKLSKSQVVIASMRRNGTVIYSPYLNITVNKLSLGDPPTQITKVLSGGNTSAASDGISVKVDYPTRSINFSGGMDWIFYTNENQMITSAIPFTGLSLKIPNYEEMNSQTSGLALMFNTGTKGFAWIPYNKIGQSVDDILYRKPWSFLGTIRRYISGSDGLSYFAANLPFPWVAKNALYGQEINKSSGDAQQIISVPADAAISNIWHRGYSALYPENTLIAYRAAKKFGCNEVEMDLDYTSDGIPVNLHDGTINRTGRNLDGSSIAESTSINGITYEQTKNYEFGSWKDPKFKGEQLPTFEECLMLCKRLNMTLHVDRAWRIDREERFDQMKEIVNRVGYENIVWYVNQKNQAQSIRRMFPKGDIYFLLSEGDITQVSIDTCVEYNLSSKRNEGRCEILSKGSYSTQSGIKSAIDSDVKVNLWAADSIDRNLYTNWGVTGFSTNGVNIMQELVEDI